MANIVARENVKNWDPKSRKLFLFRRGLEEMQKISETSQMDERGYQWVAGVHGGFGNAAYCQHGNLNFITWHRPYVLDFELKLRDQIRKIAGAEAADAWRLPYWDWAAADVTGLPDSFTVATYVDLDTGATRPNPLLAQPYQLQWDPALDDFPPPDPTPPAAWPTMTYRKPGTLEALKRLRQGVLDALKESDFRVFSRADETPHNGLHNWMAGYMATFRSSFDPIFWVHHANIDRQFWIWQETFGNSSIPQAVRDFACQPFKFKDIKAQAFFDTDALGYTYAERQTVTSHALAVSAARAKFDSVLALHTESLANALSVAPPPAPEPPKALDVELEPIDGDFDRAYLRLVDLEHTEKTYEIRVFANPKATPNEETPLTDEENYLGSFVILGHGSCPGAPGHCDRKALAADGLRQEHHLAPGDALLVVTQKLRTLTEARGRVGAEPLSVSLVVVNVRHQQVSHEEIKFARLSLTIR